MTNIRNKRILSILISILMIMNMFMAPMPVFGTSPVAIAEWNFTSAPESAIIPATGGIQAGVATLTNQMGKKPSYTASSHTIYTNGWNYNPETEDPKYWEFSVSTQGYSDLAFTANSFSTAAGPRDFKIVYSIDNGANWNEVPNSSRQIETTSLPSPSLWNAVTFPDNAGNQSNLKIRLVITSNTRQSGTGTIDSGGNSRLAAISITGTASGGGETTAPVITHTPVSVAIANTDIPITAGISDATTVTAAVYYGTSANGNIFTNFVPMVNTSGTSFEAAIPGHAEGDLYYYIAAINSGGQRATYPASITNGHKITVKSPITIAAARANSNGTTVTVTGVVTFIDGSSNYYIQDGTGAIDLYRSGLSLAVGDRVCVTGPLAEYNNLREVAPVSAADVAVLSRGNALPIPRPVTIPEIGEEFESHLVRLEQVTLGTVDIDDNTSITDSQGRTINIYRIPTLIGIVKGDTVDITAIVSQHNDNYQLRVPSAADVALSDLGPDTVPPVIIHTAVTTGNIDVDLEIQASITDDRRTVYEAVYYRTTGQSAYTVLSMERGEGSTFSASIPKSQLGMAGLQYYIEASDGTNTVTLPVNAAVPYNVTILDEDISGPEVTNLSPADGLSAGSNLRPAISASYSDRSGINTGNVRLFLDGIDVTSAAAVTANGITYMPSDDLARTSHWVELRVSDTAGNETITTWSFSAGVQTFAPDGETGTAVQWLMSSGDDFTQPIQATGGDFKALSNLSLWFGTSNPALNFGSGGINHAGGWNNGANNNYWKIQTSTRGMADLSLSWRMRSSGTGPRDFNIQYSLDNSTWNDVPNSSIQVPSALAISADASLFSVDLPDAADNQAALYLKWIMTSNSSANGGTVGSGGTHQINNIVIDGAYLVGDNQVHAVTADVPEGGVPLHSPVAFSSGTSAAVIKYSTDGGTTYTTAENGQVTLNTLPAVLHVKAVKAGMDDSRVKTFVFTQAKVSTISASHPAGAVPSNAVITLTVTPEDATIKYVLTKKAGTEEEAILPEATYIEPIALSEDMFPVRISAQASKDNYLDSDTITFNYTARRPTGGERNYFGQLHSHTTNSDGAGTLEEAFAWARDNAKLDFFAVTDHSNSFDTAPSGDTAGTYNLGAYNSGNERWQAGKNAAAAAAVPGEYVSFYGYEMTWSGGPGHINTFATEGFVSRNNTELNNKVNDAGMRAYYDLLKLHPESISQFNHPGTTFGNFSGFAYYDPIIDERITLIEVGNGEGAIGSGGYFPSYEQYDMALDKGWHVAKLR